MFVYSIQHHHVYPATAIVQAVPDDTARQPTKTINFPGARKVPHKTTSYSYRQPGSVALGAFISSQVPSMILELHREDSLFAVDADFGLVVMVHSGEQMSGKRV